MYVPAGTGAVGVLNVNVVVAPGATTIGPTTPGMKKLCDPASVFLIVTSTGWPSRTKEISPIGTDERGGPIAGPGTRGLPAVGLRANPRIQTGLPSVMATYPSLISSGTLTVVSAADAVVVETARNTPAPPATVTMPPAPALRNAAR